jgi:hypothetical protein
LNGQPSGFQNEVKKQVFWAARNGGTHAQVFCRGIPRLPEHQPAQEKPIK